MKRNEAFRLHLINEIKKSSKVQVVEIQKPASELDVFTLVSDEDKKCESRIGSVSREFNKGSESGGAVDYGWGSEDDFSLT